MMNHLGQGMGSEWREESIEQRSLFEALNEDAFEQKQPIEVRTSEAEKLYANLLMKTDFERDFIEDVLEIEELSEEQEMRIEELRRKRREMKKLAQSGGIPPTKTIVI
jgi:hypothetical protein